MHSLLRSKRQLLVFVPFPFICALTDDHGVYMRIARPYHYLIFYQVVDGSLVVRNLRHPARRCPTQLDRAWLREKC